MTCCVYHNFSIWTNLWLKLKSNSPLYDYTKLDTCHLPKFNEFLKLIQDFTTLINRKANDQIGKDKA